MAPAGTVGPRSPEPILRQADVLERLLCLGHAQREALLAACRDPTAAAALVGVCGATIAPVIAASQGRLGRWFN